MRNLPSFTLVRRHAQSFALFRGRFGALFYYPIKISLPLRD
jgi:hypothetical protein